MSVCACVFVSGASVEHIIHCELHRQPQILFDNFSLDVLHIKAELALTKANPRRSWEGDYFANDWFL